jgi:propionyl-CoA carboxylase beta chain
MKMDKNQDLLNRREQSKLGGGAERINKQHQQGKLSARERLTVLLDEYSFQEIGAFVEHRSNAFWFGQTTFSW